MPLRPPEVLLAAMPRAPWWAQRLAKRAVAAVVMAIAGRQVGKTEIGAAWLLDDWPAGERGQGLLLTPTYRIGLPAIMRLREIGERMGATWNAQEGCLTLPGGQRIWWRSCDRPDATRGLDQVRRVWIDECTLISARAWEAVLGCTVSAKDPRILLTGTPKGKGHWTHKVWTDKEDPPVRVSLRSDDSPISNKRVIARLRRQMSTTAAAQELDAKFIDDELIPFPPEVVERMFATSALKRRGNLWTLGWDLAKQKHFCVVTAMNEFGEAWVLDRWQHAAWPDSQKRFMAHVGRYEDCVVAIDEGYGGGYGGVMADYVEAEIGKARVLRVRTGNPGVKAEIIEALSADAQYERVTIDPSGPHAGVARDELLQMVGDRQVVAGVERIVYPGPVNEDEEHDDCAISLALANWGRIQGIEAPGEAVWESVTVTRQPPAEERDLIAGLAVRPGKEAAIVVLSHEPSRGRMVVERFERGAAIGYGLLDGVKWLAVEASPHPRPPSTGWPVTVLVVETDLELGAEQVGRLLAPQAGRSPALVCRDDRVALALRAWRWTEAGKPDKGSALPAAVIAAVTARLDELEAIG